MAVKTGQIPKRPTTAKARRLGAASRGLALGPGRIPRRCMRPGKHRDGNWRKPLSRTGSRFSQNRRANPLPLAGETDSAEGRARRGEPGIGLPVEAAARPASTAGARPTRSVRPGPLRLRKDFESLVGQVLDARRPPSRSAFGQSRSPHKGEEERPPRRQMCECRSPNGRGAGVRVPAEGQRAEQAPPCRRTPSPGRPSGATHLSLRERLHGP